MNNNIKELLENNEKLTNQLTEQMKVQEALFNDCFSQGMKQLNKSDADKLQSVKTDLDKALRLAREGNSIGCNEILSKYGGFSKE